jgi:hypothetical protein
MNGTMAQHLLQQCMEATVSAVCRQRRTGGNVERPWVLSMQREVRHVTRLRCCSLLSAHCGADVMVVMF